MEEILYKADIVVYGAERSRVPGLDADYAGTKDAIFEVYCVMKNSHPDLDIPETIRLLEVEPITSCTGTEYELNQDILLAIKPKGENFEWHEVNVTPDNMAFVVTNSVMTDALTVCGLDTPTLPTGRGSSEDPSCPALNQIVVTADTCTNTAISAMQLTTKLLFSMLTIVIVALFL